MAVRKHDGTHHVLTADPEQLAAAAAGLVRSRISELLAERATCSIAMTGGSSPVRTYQILAASDLPWHSIHFVQTDQRVTANPAESAWKIISENILDPAGIPQENRHPIETDTSDPEQSATRYSRTLSAFCHGGVPDIALLSIGDGGHTASLFPGDPALESEDPVAVTGVHNGSVRVTLTPRLLACVGLRILLAAGHGKATEVRKLVEGKDASPAREIMKNGGILVVDEAAFAEVTTEINTVD